jgi:ferredoxin
MRILVDLNRCQSYGQCVFAAPSVFELRGEALEYEYTPEDSLRGQVRRAAAACPVQAITIGSPGPDNLPYVGRVNQGSRGHGE